MADRSSSAARSSEQPTERRSASKAALVGGQIRQAREARSLTIDQVSVATRIRAHYLRAIEGGDFSALPSAAQARGFLRTYAGYLGLDADGLLAQLDEKQSAAGAEPARGPASAAEQKTGPNLRPDPAPTVPAARRFAAPETPAVQQPAAAPDEASLVFIEVGERLRRQRELLGLSLEDVERHTHLRLHYLQALESGSLDALPSPVQGRGMLNNYATFLGLNPEPLLLRFAEGLQLRLAARQAGHSAAAGQPAKAQKDRRPLPAPIRRLLSGDVLIGGALAVFLVIFALWAATRIFAISTATEATSTAPSIADVLLATATATITPTPLPPSATPPAPLAFPPPGAAASPGVPMPGGGPGPQSTGAPANVQVYMNVLQRAWLRATVDGQIEYEGRVLPGTPLSFSGASQVEILTSNGAGLQVYLNGADLGRLGSLGEVVNRVYTTMGAMTPTPTITATPPPQPTPGPTNTLAPQATGPALP